MSIFESFLRGRQAAQAQALNQLKLQQAQQLAPIQQQLQQLELQRARQQIALDQERQKSADLQKQRGQTLLAGRLAEQALTLEDPEIRSTFLLGAAQKAGISGQFDPDSVTDEDLMQFVAAKQSIDPSSTDKLGRFKASVVGNKVHVIDSVTGESKITNLGEDVFKPEGMSEEDFEVFRTMSPKDQSSLLKTQLDPKIKTDQQDRLNKLKTAQDLQRTAIDIIDRISSAKKLPDVLGSIEGSVDFRLDQGEADIIADIEELGNILLSDKLDLMSGVLSESDIKILKNLAAGGINRVASPSRFNVRLKNIRDAFEGKLKDESELPSPDLGNQVDDKQKRLQQLRREVGL